MVRMGLGTLLSVVAAFLCACTVQPSAVQRAEGDVTVRLPVVGPDGVEALDEVVLRGIRNLWEVKGDYASFTFAPKVAAGGLKGDSPRAHFITAEGLFIPTDETTQQLSMIYSQLQELFALDRRSGAGDVLSWPRSVGFSVRVRDEVRGGFTADNAFYDGDSDALLIVPYKNGRLPLAMNPGVLAHEHFHALFYRLVYAPLLKEKLIAKNLRASAHGEDDLRAYFDSEIDEETVVDRGPEKPTRPQGADDQAPGMDPETFQRLYHSVLLKSVNEGLADVWGWIRTGDADFLARSLPTEASSRTLRLSAQTADRARLMDGGMLAGIVRRFAAGGPRQENVFNQFAYRPGTDLARAVRHILAGGRDLVPEEEELRAATARRLVKALPKIVEEIRTRGAGLSDFTRILQVILEAEPLDARQTAEARRWTAGGKR